MIPPILLRYLPYLIGVAVIVGAIWAFGHSCYKAGQAERTAHYQPLLTAIDRERLAAESRVNAIQTASAALTADQEKRHVERLQAIQNRATRAEQRMVALLQVGAGRCRDPVPASAATATVVESAAEELERLGRVGAGIAAVGRRCEEDAGQLAELQRFYEAQRSLLAVHEIDDVDHDDERER